VFLQADISGGEAGFIQRIDSFQRAFQLEHLAGCHPADSYFGDQAFEVAHDFEVPDHIFPERGIRKEMFHGIQSFPDGLYIFQREDDPSPEEAGSHGRDGFVEHMEQRPGVFVGGVEQLEVTDGEAVEPDIVFFFDP